MRSGVITTPEMEWWRSSGLSEGVNNGSAVGAMHMYPCKTTNPSLSTMYFIEYESGYLFDFHDRGYIQISNHVAPTALL